MAKKLQQYYIYKFDTDRLKNENYDIVITLNQARKNGEVVSIGDSQMLRSLRKIKKIDVDYHKELIELFDEKKKLKSKMANHADSQRLYMIESRIDSILFVPEIVSIVIKNIQHYEQIIENGLFVNNKHFVRLMCSAGQARRNNVLFIDAEYEKQLKKILNNGRNEEVEITPAKFNAYFALASSSALPVSTPYFCVIPDYEITRKENVEFITEMEDGDDLVDACEKEIQFNIFDGQGIISPRMAKQWAEDLGLDYIPACFVIRSNFIKGMVAVIDFMKFSDEIGKHIIKDIYGNDVNVRDMDVILTASQFKLWNSFDSLSGYNQHCKDNELEWSVTRSSPKEENTHTFLNYQFIQALDLKDEQIEGLCSKTIEYFNNVMKNELDYTLLYLLGTNANKEYDANIFDKINDNVTKAIILNNQLIDDPYIQSYIAKSLNKKIRESYIGNLLVEGFYTFMVSDPYAFMEYMFGMEVHGLLGRNEHYNKYWTRKGFDTIAGMRSPLTWRSEVDVLHLKDSPKIHEWYSYLTSCCVFNIHGMDMALLGGADTDGDIICLTNQKEIVESATGGLPVMYETRKAPKSKIDESTLYKSDIKGFNTKVGFLTNCSTTMYAMLPLFSEESKEYQELVRRLKQCRKEQGAIIDSTKGLVIKPIPSHWTNWKKIEEGMSAEEIEKHNFRNSILVDKRPMFMRYLYPEYNKKYQQHYYNYNLYCVATFGIELEEMILKGNFSQEEKEFLDKYYKYSPLLNSNCTMNKISSYMQNKVKEIKHTAVFNKNHDLEDNIRMLKSPSLEIDKSRLDSLYRIYKKYKRGKRNFGEIKDDDGDTRFKTIEQYNKSIRQESFLISSDICELASLAVIICYELHPSDNKAFAWNIFGEGIVENVLQNRQEKIQVPFLDKNGDIKYLGNAYSRMDVNITNVYNFL